MSTITKEEITQISIDNLDIPASVVSQEVKNILDNISTDSVEVDEESCRDMVKFYHHPEYGSEFIADIPTISLSKAYLFYQYNAFTYSDLATLSTETIADVASISGSHAQCIKASAQNHARIDDSLTVSISEETPVSPTNITKTYDTLIKHGFSSYQQIQPDTIESFLIKYFTNDDLTAIYNFEFLSPDLINLLIHEGYTTAQDITSEYAQITEETQIHELRYANIYGDDNVQIGDDTVHILRKTAECKLSRENNEYSDSLNIPTISETINMGYEYEISFERQMGYRRIAVIAVESALEFNWSREIISDGIRFFAKATKNGILHGGSLEETVTACLRISSVAHNKPTPFDDLANIVEGKTGNLQTRSRRIISETDITDEINMEDLIIDPTDCIPYIKEQLPNSTNPELYNEIESRLIQEEVNGNSPWTEAGAATYAVLEQLEQEKYTQDKIGDAISLSSVTIRKNYKKYLRDDSKPHSQTTL